MANDRKKLKDRIDDKAWVLVDTLAAQARVRFINWIMKEEGVDYAEAEALATGRTDPPEYEFTLGYKLADPVLQMAMSQLSSKNRKIAIANFEKRLCPEELELFRKHYDAETGKRFRKALEDERKGAKQ